MQWFYIRNEERFGPVEESALFQLAREDKLSPGDLVWNPSMGEQWKPASSIPDLFAAPAIVQPSPSGGTPNRILMERAIQSLSGQWALAVGATLFYQVVMTSVQMLPYIGPIFLFLIMGSFLFGWNRFFLKIARRETADIGGLFEGFKLYGKTLGAYALMCLFLALWSLLLIIPGILAAILIPVLGQSSDALMILVPFFILFCFLMALPVIRAALSYSQLFYILSDHPEMGATEALTRSTQIMMGFKWKKFCLGWRFFGWALLALFTCGIGFLWLYPYMMTANAQFYDDIRNQIEKP